MRKIMPFFLVLFYSAGLFAQSSKDEAKKMVDSAINMVYHYLREDSIRPYQINNDYLRRIYLVDEQEAPLNYLHDTLDKRFNYLNIYNKSSSKVLKRGIRAWKVIPSLQGKSFSIGIIEYTVTHKNNTYRFAKGGSGTTIFEFDCKLQKWVFKSFNYHDF